MNEADPRVIRTRQLLQTALGELLAKKDFRDITVQDIADRATLNRATFYAHFADKYALMEYSVRETFKQALSTRLSMEATLSPANLNKIIVIVCEYLRQFFDHCAPSPSRAQLRSVTESQVKAQLYEVLLSWLLPDESNRSGNMVASEQAATVTSWAIYGAAQRWVEGDRALSPEDYARQILPFILAPLRAHTAR